MTKIDEQLIDMFETRREAFQDVLKMIEGYYFEGHGVDKLKYGIKGRIEALNETIEKLLVP